MLLLLLLLLLLQLRCASLAHHLRADSGIAKISMVLAAFGQNHGNKNRDCSVERQIPHSKRLNLTSIDEARAALDGDHVN